MRWLPRYVDSYALKATYGGAPSNPSDPCDNPGASPKANHEKVEPFQNAANHARPLQVGFQGHPGAYSEEAARQFLTGMLEPVPLRTFADVFAALENRSIDTGLVPIENTLAGSIHQNHDLLLAFPFQVVGETVLRVKHNLIGVPGATIEGLKTVQSHPVALAQCETFLKSNAHMQPRPAEDTAGSVLEILAEGDPAKAAIAGKTAAELHGGAILAAGIESNPKTSPGSFLSSAMTSKARRGCPVTCHRPGPTQEPKSLCFSRPQTAPALFMKLWVALQATTST